MSEPWPDSISVCLSAVQISVFSPMRRERLDNWHSFCNISLQVQGGKRKKINTFCQLFHRFYLTVIQSLALDP